MNLPPPPKLLPSVPHFTVPASCAVSVPHCSVPSRRLPRSFSALCCLPFTPLGSPYPSFFTLESRFCVRGTRALITPSSYFPPVHSFNPCSFLGTQTMGLFPPPRTPLYWLYSFFSLYERHFVSVYFSRLFFENFPPLSLFQLTNFFSLARPNPLFSSFIFCFAGSFCLSLVRPPYFFAKFRPCPWNFLSLLAGSSMFSFECLRTFTLNCPWAHSPPWSLWRRACPSPFFFFPVEMTSFAILQLPPERLGLDFPLCESAVWFSLQPLQPPFSPFCHRFPAPPVNPGGPFV